MAERKLCPADYPHIPHAYLNDRWGGANYDEPYRLRCPGRDLDAVKRARLFPTSVRREVLRVLRESSRHLGWMIGDWSVDGSVRDATSGHRNERPRRVSEWPENSHESWTDLANHADALARVFARLARDAAENAAAISRSEGGQ